MSMNRPLDDRDQLARLTVRIAELEGQVAAVRALCDAGVRRHNRHHRGQSGWPDLDECPDCVDLNRLLIALDPDPAERGTGRDGGGS